MADARLVHSDRGTLPFEQRQRDEAQREAQASITAELGTDRPPLVHTETRNHQRNIRGRVTANNLASDDPDTDDQRQALANYADLLESHCDEQQGFYGYTYEDDILGEELNCAIESVSWSMMRGQPYDFEFDVTVHVGQPTMGSESRNPRNPTPGAPFDTMLRVDGETCPGMRQYEVERSVGFEVKGIWNRETAENNDIVLEEGAQQVIRFEGTITGTREERESKDAALRDRLATADPITLETRFPGYELGGYVVGYNSEQRREHGERMHYYTLQFIEGTRA